MHPHEPGSFQNHQPEHPTGAFTRGDDPGENWYVFVVYYVAVANSWIGEAFFNTRFDTDDAVVRLLTVVRVASIVVMGYGVHDQRPTAFAIG